jgi:hypothetical protein
MTPPQSQFGPCRRARGTVWPSRSSEPITDWPSRRHRKMLISNEADRLVYEPGLAGQKIASDDRAPFHAQRDGALPLRLRAIFVWALPPCTGRN